MKVEIPLSPFYPWEKVRMRAIKGSLAYSLFRVLVAAGMDESGWNEDSPQLHSLPAALGMNHAREARRSR